MMRLKLHFTTDLKDMMPADVTKEKFLSDYRVSSETVGPTIAADIKSRAVWAVGLSLIMMFFYIFMRFKNWQYGLGAMVAVAHDVMIVIGIYSLLWGILPFYNGDRSVVYCCNTYSYGILNKRHSCRVRQTEGVSSSSQETSC